MDSFAFSQACENNKDFILEVLREAFADRRDVLEIASGTGQHACYFAAGLPELEWQPTDMADNLPGMERWLGTYADDNLRPARELDVRWRDWGVEIPEAVFSANSLHIMGWSAVEALFAYLGTGAPAGNRLCIYGPFNYEGLYTSASNARFDQWLAEQNPDSAIRDFEAVDELANSAGYQLRADHSMPANNRFLVWDKT